MSNFEFSARRPVLFRVFTDAGEIVEHFARSLGAAQGWFSHCVAEEYFFGAPKRVEYEFYKGYRWG